jgi:hypothetical protein
MAFVFTIQKLRSVYKKFPDEFHVNQVVQVTEPGKRKPKSYILTEMKGLQDGVTTYSWCLIQDPPKSTSGFDWSAFKANGIRASVRKEW